MQREEFTNLEKFPKEWNVYKVEDLLNKFQNGYAFSSSGYSNKTFDVIPIITMANISIEGSFNFDYQKSKKWNLRDTEKLRNYLVKNGDLIIAMTDVTPSMELIGRGAFVSANSPLLLNQRVGLLKTNDIVDNKFLSYFFNSNYWRNYSKISSSLGAQANISTKDILKGKIPLPSLPEQKKIAEILSGIDQELNSIQLSIDSLDLLYQSLLLDVLKKLSNKSTNYKLSDACNDVFLGLTSKVDYVEKNGIPLVRATNIINGNIDFENTRKISIKQHKALTKYRQTELGDVLVTKSGSLGECAVVKEKKEFSIYESIICLKPKKNLLSTQYLYHAMKSNSVRDQFSKGKVGSAVSHLNLNDFRKIIIPIPSLDVQANVSNALDSISKRREKLQLKLQKSKFLKSALSSDLLSGRKRVDN